MAKRGDSGHGPHFQFGVDDVEKMCDFYTKHLGCTIKRPIRTFKNIPFFNSLFNLEEHEAKGVTLSIPGTNFYLDLCKFIVPKAERHHPEQPKMSDLGYTSGHLCFYVDDIMKKYEEMKKEGVKFFSEPKKNDWFKTSLVFGYDPEGNMFELLQEHLDEIEKPQHDIDDTKKEE